MSNAVSQEAKSSISAVANTLRDTLRQDLDAVRTAIDENLRSAVQQTDVLFDRFLLDVREVVRAASEKAASDARSEAEHAAERELTAARAEAQQQIAALGAELDEVRTSLEAKLREAEARRDELAKALGASQRELEAAGQARDDHAAAFTKATSRIAELERERDDLMLASQLADAYLDEERQRQKTLAVQLETAREELRLAQTEAKASRLEAQRAAAGRQRPGAAEHTPPDATPAADSNAVLEDVKHKLMLISSAQTADQMLVTLVDSLAEHFACAALFTVGANGFKRWRSSTAPADAAPVPLLPLKGDSVLARAWRERTSVVGGAPLGDDVLRRDGSSAGREPAALPLVANDRVVAIAYVENPAARTPADAMLFTKAAEILIDRIGTRLQRSKAAPEAPKAFAADVAAVPGSATSPRYTPARRASRVRMQDRIDAVVNGGSGRVVDLSTLGAQVVCSHTVAPDGTVDIAFPRLSGPLTCKARVVWIKQEHAGNNKMLSRAGLQFIDVDTPAIQALMTEHGVVPLSPVPGLES